MPGQTFAYLRVSKLDQDLEKNKAGILKLANDAHLGHVQFIEEKLSGKISWRKRQIATILEQVVAALSPYIRQHINRFGRYQLDLTQPPPPLNYDIRVVTSKKKPAGFVASEAQKKAKARQKKKKSARQMRLFS